MAKSNPVEKLSYEKAFEELETIVNGLESNQLSLEEGMALFERGQILAQHCAQLLEQAELKIRQLTQADDIAAGSVDLDEAGNKAEGL